MVGAGVGHVWTELLRTDEYGVRAISCYDAGHCILCEVQLFLTSPPPQVEVACSFSTYFGLSPWV